MMRRLLLPVAVAYGAAAAVRRRAYRAGYLPVGRAPVPVISVGSLTAGGSGKTPVAGWLAAFLMERGVRTALVHSGYGGREAGRVQRVYSSWRWERGAAARVGDEPLLLAAWQPEALVFAGRDRLAAARCAAEAGAQVVVVDDGFQHRRLHRDLDLLLEDGRSELPFPAGLGREGASAAADADLFWEHRRAGEPARGHAPVSSRWQPEAIYSMAGRRVGEASELRGRRVFLLAGIARPERFSATVRALGALLIGSSWARDHRPFSAGQLRRAARSGAELILCTEKDAVRVAGAPECSNLVYLSGRIELTRGLPVLEQRLGRLGRGGG